MSRDDPDIKRLNSKLGDERFQQIADQASFLNNQFKNRRRRVREKLLQPPTPTKEDLDLLDVEVEENLKTKILIQDDFSSSEPDQGLSVLKRFCEGRSLVSGYIPDMGNGFTEAEK